MQVVARATKTSERRRHFMRLIRHRQASTRRGSRGGNCWAVCGDVWCGGPTWRLSAPGFLALQEFDVWDCLVHFDDIHARKVAMNCKSRLVLSGVVGRAIASTMIALCESFAGAQSAVTPAAPKTTDQAFKNIQILKGISADQLIPSMQFISTSLGVECEYCHVEGAFEKDDKKPKQTARKMMEMMFAINKGNFEDHRAVTCYTCHRGNAHPVAIPIIPSQADTAAHPEPMKTADGKDSQAEDSSASSKAVVDPILEKYIAGLGGAASIQKVTSRVQKGSADLAGKQFPIDIYAQAPDKRVSAMHLPNGDSITAYNGTVGWLSVPGRPVHWMSQAEAEA